MLKDELQKLGACQSAVDWVVVGYYKGLHCEHCIDVMKLSALYKLKDSQIST